MSDPYAYDGGMSWVRQLMDRLLGQTDKQPAPKTEEAPTQMYVRPDKGDMSDEEYQREIRRRLGKYDEETSGRQERLNPYGR